MKTTEVLVKLLTDSAKLPTRGSEKASGWDLYADIDEPLKIEPGRVYQVPTGISIQLPSGYEAQIRPRSGLAWHHGLTVMNTPGTVDEDYTGQIYVLLVKLADGNKDKENNGIVYIRPGERVAQMVISTTTNTSLRAVSEIRETARGASGFGDSGRF